MDNITRCPTCGSMLHMDHGMDDFPGVKNEIGTCTFCAVDARHMDAMRDALEKIQLWAIASIKSPSVMGEADFQRVEKLCHNALHWEAPRQETLLSIAAWHEQTFPDATEEAQLQKYKDEAREFAEAGTPLEEMLELADMVIVAAGLMRWDIATASHYLHDTFELAGHSGYDEDDVQRAVNHKMSINRKRTWDCKNGKYQHKEEKK